MPAMLSRRRFDVEEYHRMIRAGIVLEGDRVELLDGEIVEMHGIGSRHAACVLGLSHRLITALSGRALVAVQNPVRVDRRSETEPDLAVLRLRNDLYATEPPSASDTLLIIEVADTSLGLDRRVKLPLYAAAGIQELWVVDLTTDTVEVHREPRGRSYETSVRLTSGAVAPLAFPDLELEVAAIFPPSA